MLVRKIIYHIAGVNRDQTNISLRISSSVQKERARKNSLITGYEPHL